MFKEAEREKELTINVRLDLECMAMESVLIILWPNQHLAQTLDRFSNFLQVLGSEGVGFMSQFYIEGL